MTPRPASRRPDPRPGLPVRARNGVTLGWLEGTVLSRWLRASRHRLLNPPAWTIDKWGLDQCRSSHPVMKIIIHDQDAQPGQVSQYGIDIDEWDLRATVINRGQYDQYMVPLFYWRQS